LPTVHVTYNSTANSRAQTEKRARLKESVTFGSLGVGLFAL